MYDVFLSYRRDGGLDLAGRIKDHLSQKGFNPFYDVEAMKSGRFDKQIYDRIDECEHFLLILPPKGLNRCKYEDDWVRKEIEYAIKKKKHIVTVLMPGFSFPRNLPDSIEIIKYVQAVLPSPDAFEHTINKICEYLNDSNWQSADFEDLHIHLKTRGRWKSFFRVFFVICISVAILCAIIFLRPWTLFTKAPDKTTPTDTSIPSLSISKPTARNDEIVFHVYADEETDLASFEINSLDISTIGFSADIKVEGNGATKRIVLSNIIVASNTCYIVVTDGVAVDSSGNKSKSIQSSNIDFSDFNSPASGAN